MNAMKYKGYAARIEYDAHDRIFVGHLVGIRDIVGFHGGCQGVCYFVYSYFSILLFYATLQSVMVGETCHRREIRR